MKRLMLCLVLLLPLASTGCISSIVNDAMDQVEERLYDKFENRWTPALISKVELELAGFREAVIERVDENTQSKLDRLEIDLSDYDQNQDGQLEFTEGLGLLREMHKKNKEQGSPFTLIEVLLAFAGVYGGGSLVKGGVRKVMGTTGTGDGTVRPVADV